MFLNYTNGHVLNRSSCLKKDYLRCESQCTNHTIYTHHLKLQLKNQSSWIKRKHSKNTCISAKLKGIHTAIYQMKMAASVRHFVMFNIAKETIISHTKNLYMTARYIDLLSEIIRWRKSFQPLLTKSVFPTVCNVEESIFIFMFFVNGSHCWAGSRQNFVDKEKHRFFWRQLDPLPDYVHKLSHC